MKQRKVYIIGVNHRIQYTKANYLPEWKAEIRTFEDYVAKTATQLDTDLIAEEFNEEAIRRNDASGCTVRDASMRINRLHIFLDPDTSERPKSCNTKEEKRLYKEEEWLRRLGQADGCRILVVCGDGHVVSFTSSLHNAGYDIEVLSHNWGGQLDSEITEFEVNS